ncbi:MAG: hypothetical protein WD056_00560, partial [Gemmatimonadota bacterium]
MAGMGRMVQVPLTQPSATVAAPEPQRRGRNNRNRDDDDDDDEPTAAQGLERLRAAFPAGLPAGLPAAAEEILSRLQSGGGQIQIEGNQIIMQGPGGQQIRVNPAEGAVQMFRLQRGQEAGQGGGQ